MKKHPGFEAEEKQIMKKEGYGKERAGAILAASARKASPAAVKHNPKLLKVTGVKKSTGRKG